MVFADEGCGNRCFSLRKQIVKVVSACMLVVFLIGVMPKEYLHNLLYRHTDTEHPIYKRGDFVIGPKHTHCQFLALALAPYVSTPFFLFSFREVCRTTIHYLHSYHFEFLSFHSFISLRGPPIESIVFSFLGMCSASVTSASYVNCDF